MNILDKIYDFKNKIDAIISLENLINDTEVFLEEMNLNTSFFAILTIKNYKVAALSGISRFPQNQIAEIQNQLLPYISERIDQSLEYRYIKYEFNYKESLTDDDFCLNNIVVFPLILENHFEGAILIYDDCSYSQNRSLYSLLVWLFKDKYLEIENKHQVLVDNKINAINEAIDMIHSDIKVDDMFSILGDILLEISVADYGALFLVGKEDSLDIKTSWAMDYSRNDSFLNFEKDYPYSLEWVQYDKDKTLLNFVKEANYKVILEDFAMRLPNNYDEVEAIFSEILFLPIIINENVEGYVCLIRKNKVLETFSKDDRSVFVLETIVSLVATALRNNKLQEQSLKEKMTQKELQVAHNIQVGLQTKNSPNLQNFDIAAKSVPARIIGGDYFDFFVLDNENIGISLTDIVGKGIPAALIMAFFKGVMQLSVQDSRSPSKVFEKISYNLYKNKSTKNFIPSFYSILDDEKCNISFTNAGLEKPLYYNSESDSFSCLEEGGLPLGAFEDNKYEEGCLALKKNDILIIFTDGITEARNKFKETYGEQKLQNLIRNFKKYDAQNLVDKVYEDVIFFAKDVKQHDDFTIIVVKRK